jgi:hypothetical protein
MTAYAWEFLAQLIALKLTQHYTTHLQGFFDCKVTVALMNEALANPCIKSLIQLPVSSL